MEYNLQIAANTLYQGVEEIDTLADWCTVDNTVRGFVLSTYPQRQLLDVYNLILNKYSSQHTARYLRRFLVTDGSTRIMQQGMSLEQYFQFTGLSEEKMMEEFRPYLADRLALTLINRQQITASDFTCTEVGGVLLKEKARKTILAAWQERKREEVMHPFLGERMSVGMLCHMQARLLSRYLRGDMDAYPPFSIR